MSPVYHQKDHQQELERLEDPTLKAIFAALGAETLETRPSNIPEFVLDPVQLKEWFHATGLPAAQERGQVIGSGDMPEKGIGLIMLDAMVRNGHFDPLGRYSVPPFIAVTPSFFAPDKQFTFEELRHVAATSEHGVAHYVLRQIKAEKAIRALLNTTECEALRSAGDIIARSMGGIEGGAGQSAAGALESVVASSREDWGLVAAGIEVLSSGFSPLSLRLAERYGMNPQIPGFILQSLVKSEPRAHVIFNTAFPGEVRGYYTVNVDNQFITRAFKSQIGQSPKLEDVCELVPGAIEELACLFSNFGRVPVEMEIIYDPEDHQIQLVQHRFVKNAADISPPTNAQLIQPANAVVGCAIENISDFVPVTGGWGSNLLQAYCAIRQLKEAGRPFAILTDSATITSMFFKPFPLLQMILLEAPVVIESTGGRGQHHSDLAAHYARLVADQGTLFISVTPDLINGNHLLPYIPNPTFLGQAVKNAAAPRPRTLSELDLLFLSQLPTRPLNRSEEPLIITVEQPLTIYGCELRGEGGIFKSN